MILQRVHSQREQQRLDTLKLHMHLGKVTGKCILDLVNMHKQRYLKDWKIYLQEGV